MSEKKRFQSLSEFLFDSIAAKILNGELKVGQKLVENDLQKEYEVSKSPVREAFQMLINIGLVERKARRGCYVKQITEKTVVDNYIVRIALEGEAARMAYSTITSADIAELKSIYAEMSDAADRNETLHYLECHDRFQSFFSEKSDNDTLVDFCRKIRMQNMWYRTQYLMVNIQSDLHTHDILIERLERREDTPEGFGALMKEHIKVGLDNFLKYRDRERAAKPRPK